MICVDGFFLYPENTGKLETKQQKYNLGRGYKETS